MSDARPVLGRRIVIYGVTGSGKTTLAKHLAARLGLPRIELDAIRHAHGWDTTSFDEMREQLVAAIAAAPDGWVCDGNYRQVRDVTLSIADTVVWIRLPWHASFSQLLRRTLARLGSHEPLYSPEGPRESWRATFLDRRSILWWAIHHHRKTTSSIQQALRDAPRDAVRIELRSRADVDALARSVDE